MCIRDSGGDPFIMHDAPGAEHIFCELYSVPDEIRATYFQLKVLELLLFLQVLDPGPVRERRPYFYRAQVENCLLYTSPRRAAHRRGARRGRARQRTPCVLPRSAARCGRGGRRRRRGGVPPRALPVRCLLYTSRCV